MVITFWSSLTSRNAVPVWPQGRLALYCDLTRNHEGSHGRWWRRQSRNLKSMLPPPTPPPQDLCRGICLPLSGATPPPVRLPPPQELCLLTPSAPYPLPTPTSTCPSMPLHHPFVFPSLSLPWCCDLFLIVFLLTSRPSLLHVSLRHPLYSFWLHRLCRFRWLIIL